MKIRSAKHMTRKMYKDHKCWTHSGPRKHVDSLIKTFGHPAADTIHSAVWYNIDGFDVVEIKDEEIPHSFPAEHIDWCYGTLRVPVPAKYYTDFAKVTGSIIIDGLKQEVTARCQSMIANAVTIGFVQDVVAGLAKPTKQEYAKRIKNLLTPAWFPDSMNEGKPQKK